MIIKSVKLENFGCWGDLFNDINILPNFNFFSIILLLCTMNIEPVTQRKCKLYKKLNKKVLSFFFKNVCLSNNFFSGYKLVCYNQIIKSKAGRSPTQCQ